MTGLIVACLIGALAATLRQLYSTTRDRDNLRAACITTIANQQEDYRMLIYGLCAELGVDECQRVEAAGRTGPWASPASVERYAAMLDQRAATYGTPFSRDA